MNASDTSAGDDAQTVGVLLVGGESRRFGSPKALALIEGEQMAVRIHRLLLKAFGTAIAVGKPSLGLELPFPVLDDASDEHAALIGVAAALRLADADKVVIVPTDMPWLTVPTLRNLARALSVPGVEVATCRDRPLPVALRRSMLPSIERCLADGDYALRKAFSLGLSTRVECDERELINLNEPGQETPAPGTRSA